MLMLFFSSRYINELNTDESAELLKKFYNIILENHDLTVRFKWRNKNDFGKHLPSIFSCYAT